MIFCFAIMILETVEGNWDTREHLFCGIEPRYIYSMGFKQIVLELDFLELGHFGLAGLFDGFDWNHSLDCYVL